MIFNKAKSMLKRRKHTKIMKKHFDNSTNITSTAMLNVDKYLRSIDKE